MNCIKRYLPLIFLALVFIVPMGVSSLLYYERANLHFKTTNHGTIIKPVFSISENSVDQSTAKKWQIIYFLKECNVDNKKKVYMLHQLQKALGKDQNRVNVKVFAENNCSIPSLQILNQASKLYIHSKMPVLSFNGEVFLVDPMGNAFMFYKDADKPMDILKDLKHILGVSQIG